MGLSIVKSPTFGVLAPHRGLEIRDYLTLSVKSDRGFFKDYGDPICFVKHLSHDSQIASAILLNSYIYLQLFTPDFR